MLSPPKDAELVQYTKFRNVLYQINKVKGKTHDHLITFLILKKPLKISNTLHDKSLENVIDTGPALNNIKAIYRKPVPKFKLNGKNFKTISV